MITEREEKEKRMEREEEYRKAKEELDSKFPDVVSRRAPWIFSPGDNE